MDNTETMVRNTQEKEKQNIIKQTKEKNIYIHNTTQKTKR